MLAKCLFIFILFQLYQNNNTHLSMNIQGMNNQVCALLQPNVTEPSQFPKCQVLTQQDQQTENFQKIQTSQILASTLAEFKLEKELYYNSNKKVILVRKKSDQKLQICKITELKQNSSSVSIHLNYQLQFYNKLKQTETNYLTKIDHVFNNSQACVRIMEFACRGDLLQNLNSFSGQIDKKKHLSLVKNVLWQVVKGLEEVHNLGFAYRDLKPDNILVNHNGVVLISDFELVAPFGAIDQSICGTPQYMAPQRLSHKRNNTPISPAIDMWSLGVLAFQLLMGSTPYSYQYDNIEGLLQSMYDGYMTFDSEYPPECKNFVFNLLQTNPKKRLTMQKVKQHKFFQGVQEQPLVRNRCKCSISNHLCFRN